MNLDHTDTILTEYARLLGPTLDQFILNRVFPAVDVPSDTGDFFDVTGGFAAASPGNRTIMVDGQERPDTIPIIIDTASGWVTEMNGVGTKVTKATADKYRRKGLDARKAATEVLARYNAILRERLGAAIAFSTAVFASYTDTLSGSDQWSDDASDPVNDAKTAHRSVRRNGGSKANALIVGAEVDDHLSQHPAIVEYASRTLNSVGLLTDGQIAAAMGVADYIVGTAAANSAAPALTQVKADIWGKFALFAKLQASPSPFSPQSCLQRWRMMDSVDGAINAYMLPGDYVEQIDQLWEDQVSAPTPALGYLYAGAVA
jgi:hypothetical protein